MTMPDAATPAPPTLPDMGGRAPARSWRPYLAVLAGLVLAALNSRIMVSAVSPLTPLMAINLPLSESDQAILGLAAPLAFAVFGAIAPWFGRRFGLEAVMIAALAISAGGQLARGLAPSQVAFIGWTIPALAGAGIGNVITPPLIKKYFPDRVGMVTAVYTTCVTVSTALPPLFIYRTALATGWRFSLGIWALVGLAGIVPWLAVVFSPARAGARLAAVRRRLDPRGPVERPPQLAHPIWRRPVAWALMTVLAVNSIVAYTMFAWLPDLLRAAGESDDQAALHLVAFTIGSLPGSLIIPLITARMKRSWLLPPVFFLGYVAGFVGLALSPGSHSLIWIALTRVGDCFFPFALTMINLRAGSTRESVALSGFAQSVAYTVAAVGPWGFGLLQTHSGGWTTPLVALLCILPLQCVAGWIVARSKPAPASG